MRRPEPENALAAPQASMPRRGRTRHASCVRPATTLPLLPRLAPRVARGPTRLLRGRRRALTARRGLPHQGRRPAELARPARLSAARAAPHAALAHTLRPGRPRARAAERALIRPRAPRRVRAARPVPTQAPARRGARVARWAGTAQQVRRRAPFALQAGTHPLRGVSAARAVGWAPSRCRAPRAASLSRTEENPPCASCNKSEGGEESLLNRFLGLALKSPCCCLPANHGAAGHWPCNYPGCSCWLLSPARSAALCKQYRAFRRSAKRRPSSSLIYLAAPSATSAQVQWEV